MVNFMCVLYDGEPTFVTVLLAGSGCRRPADEVAVFENGDAITGSHSDEMRCRGHGEKNQRIPSK